MSRALIVGNNGRIRRIVADKYGITVRPAAVCWDALLGRARRNKCYLLRQKIRVQGAPRANVINDPDAAPMRSQDKIVLPRMDYEIADRDRRESIAFELRPAFSAIDRNPKPKFGTKKKEIRLNQIFLNYVRVTPNAFHILGVD